MTEDYSQPDFYHFSEDSIIVAKQAVIHIANKKELKILDACSGCGVIGIEIARKVNLAKIDFCEIQIENKVHIEKNILLFGLKSKFDIYIEDICSFDSFEKYDVITINPPYFEESRSRRSDDDRKNKCRIFETGELEAIFTNLISMLAKDGVIIFSLRDHGIFEIKKCILHSNLKLTNLISSEYVSVFSIS